jgi:hypothetical protein
MSLKENANVNFAEKMSTEDFNGYVNERIATIKDVLLQKAKEYSSNDDRLKNFHDGSKMIGKSREEVLDGFLLKHLVSYRKILEDLNNDGILPSRELIVEKMGDIINYFIIQEAQLLQRIDRITKS